MSTEYTDPCDRKFRWVSSETGNERLLAELNDQMNSFYSQEDRRSLYQEMLEAQEEEPTSDAVRREMPRYVCSLNPKELLEVGCADGRLYRQLRRYGFNGHYRGIEVAEFLIKKNQERHPEATWRIGSAYDIPYSNDTFDACFSFFVLEHLVYPAKALEEMLRVLKPGGKLVLVFPDFSKSGRFGSQLLGFSPGRAKQKLLAGHVVDACVGLYDSRLRLPKALKQASKRFGPFPVNSRPLCLTFPFVMGTDVDAIYISSKGEICDWAAAHGCIVEFPCGTSGEFAEHAFVVITKRA